MAQQTDRLLAGRYRILERLGSGGMAAVYLAEDERLRRRVAVKRLRAGSPEEAARRFTREARLLAALSHPNVVSVFDTVADDDGLLIVMEYVDGETLAEALRRGPLGPERAAEVVRAIASALDHAHARGVVHRDVKPANVLLGRDGQVKLADLGIARVAEGTQLTRTGTVLGTPSYMAPEQLEGRELTPAADVYALAAVAWEALAGRKAHEGRTPLEIAHRIATAPPPDLREAWPQAPAAAAGVLRRGMARDAADRPPTAGALARELSAALAERRPGAARVLVAGAPARRGRPRLAVWVPIALLAAAAAAVVGLTAGGDERRTAREPATALPAQPESGAEPRDGAPTESQPEPAPPEEAAADPVAEGLALQQAGYEHMQAGRLDRAIEASARAVELLEGSGRIEYWYALYNLGRSLRLAGRPGEAIPVLEQRLEHPDQRGAVERELELARGDAGASGGSGTEGDGRGRGKDKDKDKDDD